MSISILTTYPSILSFLYNVFKNAIQLWTLKVVFYIVTCHMSSCHSYVSIKYISFTILQNTIHFLVIYQSGRKMDHTMHYQYTRFLSFVYICITIGDPISKKEVGIPLTSLTLPHFCACPKS